jgi:hypothetical protein
MLGIETRHATPTRLSVIDAPSFAGLTALRPRPAAHFAFAPSAAGAVSDDDLTLVSGLIGALEEWLIDECASDAWVRALLPQPSARGNSHFRAAAHVVCASLYGAKPEALREALARLDGLHYALFPPARPA